MRLANASRRTARSFRFYLRISVHSKSPFENDAFLLLASMRWDANSDNRGRSASERERCDARREMPSAMGECANSECEGGDQKGEQCATAAHLSQ